MIIGDTVNQVAVLIKDRNNVSFPSFNLRILDAIEDKDVLIIKYEVTYDYGNAGKIVLAGEVYEKDTDKDKFKIVDLLRTWKEQKKFPSEYMSSLMTFINWVTTVHATVICQTIRFRPPVLPLSFNVKEDQ